MDGKAMDGEASDRFDCFGSSRAAFATGPGCERSAPETVELVRPEKGNRSRKAPLTAQPVRQGAARSELSPAQIHDVAPLPTGDPRGVAPKLVVLALLITLITGAALAIQSPGPAFQTA